MDLSPSFQKISRAEVKLGRINALLGAWIKRGIRYTVRRELHRNRVHVIARTEELPPEEVAWELVEAVGHLRSALDKMLVAVVDSNGRGISGVSFPFGGFPRDGKPQAFPTPRHSELKEKLSTEQWDAILSYRPYPGGNDLLWAINELANEDKHRQNLVGVRPVLMARTVSISNGVFFMDGRSEGPAISVGGDPDFVCPDPLREALLASYAYCGMHPQVDQSLGINVVFGPVEPVAGKEVPHVLAQQIQLVKSIVTHFQTEFSQSATNK